jgi:ABC-type nitrate/sulfonate/bicarbonate transport system permease component
MKLIGGADEGTTAQKLFFGLLGIALVLVVWVALTAGANPVLRPVVLPSPLNVLKAFPELFTENNLIRNMGFSIGLNLSGYLEAILITIPIGFFIGLFKYARWGFQRQVDALRYIPLTAVTLLFIVWFGIETDMKVHFLAFGIIIYMLPVMIQRIDEVDDVYLKTVHTLGATDWQVLKTVYFPSVVSRLSDDIRVLTAISWTYIIVAESINSNQGGLGTLIYNVGQRQVRSDKIFALLIIIMAIGIIQDKIFVRLDKQLFPHKYQAKESVKSSRLDQKGLFGVIADYVFLALGWIAFGIYFLLMIQEFAPFMGDFKPLSYVFGDSVNVIHIIFFLIVFFKGWKWYQQRSDLLALQVVTTKSPAA